jgi:hypothetical protein
MIYLCCHLVNYIEMELDSSTVNQFFCFIYLLLLLPVLFYFINGIEWNGVLIDNDNNNDNDNDNVFREIRFKREKNLRIIFKEYFNYSFCR